MDPTLDARPETAQAPTPSAPDGGGLNTQSHPDRAAPVAAISVGESQVPVTPAAAPPVADPQTAIARTSGPQNGNPQGGNGSLGCTAPQLRRFIKSRPYVPMHELRRRFAIVTDDDDVTRVALDDGAIFVGLPPREGALLGELLRGGEIGYELSLDPRTPVVIGVYPMRPVLRG